LNKFKKIKRGDWKAITFCVFAAITFWFFNAMTSDYSVDVTHPLVIHYDDDQYIPLSSVPNQIKFSTTASGWDIFTKTNFINSSPIELDLDDDFKKRKYITAARLKSIVAKQMDGIRINEILEDTIYVNFDKVRSKKVKLQIDPKKLLLAEGYRLSGAVFIEPSEAIVTGPSSLLKNIPDVFILKLEDKDISDKYEEEIPFNPSVDKKFKFNIDKVKVEFETFKLERIEKKLNLSKLNFPKKKKILVSEETATLIYYARKGDLPLIDLQKFDAQIDFFSINGKDKTIKIKLKRVPELINSYQFEPSTVKISYDE
jgi:hypothetical protein